MTRILIIDDTPQIVQFLTAAFEASGFEVLAAGTGALGLSLAQSPGLDLIILDLGLPDMDGKAVIAALRPGCQLPIIVLSAHDQEIERIMALDQGADDFVAKPFGIGELMARVRAALRNRSPSAPPGTAAAASPETRADPGITIDPETREILYEGRRVKLTPKEFQLAGLLAGNAGKLLPHRMILREVWGPAHSEDIAYLRVFIGQLRRKLGLTGESRVRICAEAGIGYRWEAGPAPSAAAQSPAAGASGPRIPDK